MKVECSVSPARNFLASEQSLRINAGHLHAQDAPPVFVDKISWQHQAAHIDALRGLAPTNWQGGFALLAFAFLQTHAQPHRQPCDTA